MSASHPLRLGTRGSALAQIQANLIAAALRRNGQDVDLVTIVTDGDVRPPDTAWGEGAFVGAIELALVEGRVDLAVHSAKDVPIAQAPGLTIAAYPDRADPRDALVLPAGRTAASLDDLPGGSVIGTDSPRRTGFILAARPDLRVVPIHGNVDARLARLDAGEVDALILAVAGLARLGRPDRVTLPLDPDVVPPAPGQGALAIQVRAGDQATRDAVAALDDAATRLAVSVERALLEATGGGCRAPIGALGRADGELFSLLAAAVEPDGTNRRFISRVVHPDAGPPAAREMAAELRYLAPVMPG
jgi:hydroxymethylbilane synthase